MKNLDLLVLVAVSMLYGSQMAYAMDSDGDGISDVIEASSGADPFSKYAVSVGALHTCALDENGVVCWGLNDHGETDVPPLSNPISVSVGNHISCALDDTGVVCWGQRRLPYWDITYVPLQNIPSYLSVANGGSHACAARDTRDRPMRCWGNTNYYLYSAPPSVNPVMHSGNRTDSCLLDKSSTSYVKCWGKHPLVRDVPQLSNPRAVSVGSFFACALDDTGVVCWGGDTPSKAGLEATIVPPLMNPRSVSSGNIMSCALDDTGMACWGGGYLLEELDTQPIFNVPQLSNPRAVSLGLFHACAFDDTGLVCWGENGHGQADVPPLDFGLAYPDGDKDGKLDDYDNCPNTPNPDQADLDGDGVGDACDTDVDGDSVEDTLDNCPLVANSDQLDVDGDLVGDACDDLIDNDADGIANDLDNCPAVPNPDQADNDGDLKGDACDLDDDNDGVEDTVDNCSLTANEDQADNDNDNIGDVCDSDDDNDAIEDDLDNCPLIANVSQDDNDGDGFGDVCDPDDDNDAVDDSVDNCPLSFNPDQLNTDGVGAGDACNDAFDVDDDDWENDYDNCPDVANRNQSDFDYDNIGDACDTDVDGDSAANAADACELTPLGELVGSIGCSIEQLCPCDAPRQSTEPWKNHGKYVSCMTKAAQSFAADGVISDNGKSDLVNAAAQSSCGY